MTRNFRSFAIPLLLGAICFIIYNANFRQIGAGDSLSSRYLPLFLLRDRTLDLDAHTETVARGHGMRWDWNELETPANYFESPAYWMVRTQRGSVLSMYPVVTPLLVTPLYLPAKHWLDRNGWEPQQVDRVADWMEKISASILASLASVLMYLVLRREGGRWALPLAIVFAFGTNTWMISSQALWQHGTGEIFIAAALLLVLIPGTPVRMSLLGMLCVLMSANRPPDSLFAAAFFLYAVWRRRRDADWILLGALPFLAAFLLYNLHVVGHLLGGYALGNNPQKSFFHWNWQGLAGLLLSPTRGLLVFTPFLFFLPWGLRQRLRTPETRNLACILVLAVVAQLFLYSLADWRAGVSWGPRWLTDMLPILLWMLAPAPAVLRPFARRIFLCTMGLSVGIQTVGAFWYTELSDERMFANTPTSMRNAWNPRNTPFLLELTQAPARAELLYNARGSLDQVGTTPVRRVEDVPTIKHGDLIEGWALTGNRNPAELLVLVDGYIVGSTREFLLRNDVNQALQTTAPSGWRVTANTRNIRSGEHLLQLATRISPRSDIRIFRAQRVIIVPPDETELISLSAQARAHLRQRQTKEGYWFTQHTTDMHFHNSRPEMNTFLTSMLVDMLAPVSKRNELDAELTRARQHLTAQIEANGLVRYHGLPDGPGIGTLGCIISPDSDDTALVWLITNPGPDDPRLPRMLKELSRYRDDTGLYLTWLAPRQEYQGIDPGQNPNPADVVIQMHIYLMLREFDPSAAAELSRILERESENPQLWVYYTKAPLIPYLRAAELQQVGCDIPHPTNRLAHPVPGQEIWSEAARLFVAIMQSPDDPRIQQEIQQVLLRLGHDDFALLRSIPPLLYHNDLTASVRRFYWSEDFGYALWLRLYATIGLESPGPQ